MAWYGMIWHGMVWHGMAWHGMVWYGMVWYDMAWYGMIWHGMVWHGLAWYGMAWPGMVWYGMVWYGMVWYGMVWYGMVWYGMVWTPPSTFTSSQIHALSKYVPSVCIDVSFARSVCFTAVSHAHHFVGRVVFSLSSTLALSRRLRAGGALKRLDGRRRSSLNNCCSPWFQSDASKLLVANERNNIGLIVQGWVFSKPDLANLELLKFLFSISDPATSTSLKRRKTRTVRPVFEVIIQAFWWRIRLIFTNKLVANFRINRALKSWAQDPIPKPYCPYSVFILSSLAARALLLNGACLKLIYLFNKYT